MNAHRETEVRHGPPLSFVSEKLESAIFASHGLHELAVAQGNRESERLALLAFSDGLKAVFALYDVLEQWTPGTVQALADMPLSSAEAEVEKMLGGGAIVGGNWPVEP